MEWIERKNQDGEKLPRWQRSIGVSDDGTIFVPAASAGGSENTVFFCASNDSVQVVTYLKHIYVPSSLLSLEYPEIKETCENIEKKYE